MSATQKPIVSFGIPVYNGERYLEEALRSIQEQTLSDIQIVISDNGSDDGTEYISREAAKADPRIHYVRSDVNRGGSWNYNNVWHHSSAQYFSWMAADDVKLPDFAEVSVAGLEEAGPDCVLACPGTRLIDAEGVIFEDLGDTALGLEEAQPWKRVRNLLRSQASHLMYGLIRADALRRTREVLAVYGDDMVLLTELACLGTMTVLPQRSFLQRRHPAQFSAQGMGQVTWHDPDAKVAFSFPQFSLDAELVRAVACSPLPPKEKALTMAQVGPHWAFPRWRGAAKDVLIAGRAVVSAPFHSAKLV